MRFFRHRPRLGLLALFALAMQAQLSFGHTHAHSMDARAANYDHCTPASKPTCPAPGSHDHDSTCAICWTMGLVGSLVLQQSPSVSFLELPDTVPVPLRVAFGQPTIRTIHFRARAPPLALSA